MQACALDFQSVQTNPLGAVVAAAVNHAGQIAVNLILQAVQTPVQSSAGGFFIFSLFYSLVPGT
jgi:hypothetical protein